MKKFTKKLTLNKQTIAYLNNDRLERIKGGTGDTTSDFMPCQCPTQGTTYVYYTCDGDCTNGCNATKVATCKVSCNGTCYAGCGLPSPHTVAYQGYVCPTE